MRWAVLCVQSRFGTAGGKVEFDRRGCGCSFVLLDFVEAGKLEELMLDTGASQQLRVERLPCCGAAQAGLRNRHLCSVSQLSGTARDILHLTHLTFRRTRLFGSEGNHQKEILILVLHKVLESDSYGGPCWIREQRRRRGRARGDRSQGLIKHREAAREWTRSVTNYVRFISCY